MKLGMKSGMKKEKMEWNQILLGYMGILTIFSILAAGSFFEYASSVLIIVLMVPLLVMLVKEKEIVFVKDYNTAVILLCTVMYLIVSLWAVDSGMAVGGFVKFFPMLLFYLLVCRLGQDREQLIQMLPAIAAVIVIFSSIMMQFESLKGYVSVAGRLAGTFQYPNTFAIFLLVCLIIVWYSGQEKWKKAVYAVIFLFGILYTGSRTVWLLTAALFLFLACYEKKYRKYSVGVILVCVLALVIVLVVFQDSTIADRIRGFSFSSSTFLGRLLYDKDALKLLLRKPYGLGYYGYYFMEQEIQTGVYSVLNVHNELLQLALDIGVIPAILFFGMIIKSVIGREQLLRNRLVLVVLGLHSLFDYDFQFLAVVFVLLLFLQYGKEKRESISSLTYVITGVAAVAVFGLAVVVGVSNGLYLKGKYEKAFACGKMNTMAQIRLLEQADEIDDAEKIAEDILKRNTHVPIVYETLAKAEYADGNIQNYILYEMKAIQLAPYQIERYGDYINYLSVACTQYLNNKDYESASVCYDRLEELPDILKKVKDKTSSLAWKIKDKPELELPDEYYSLVQSIKESLK